MPGLSDPSEEIAVISDELLATVIKEQASEAAKKYDGEELPSGWEDEDVKEIRIDFQRILKIDNLLTLVNLTKLQLDNNMIEKIENIDHLTQLTWLDLSFNNIEKISGLETLIHLTDLSLHHNKIKKLEGLDTLTKLDVLSIGDNELETLKDAPIIYLRSFKNLRSLNLTGNPMCEAADYESYTIAVLPQLRYLDWRRVPVETKESAAIQHQNEIEVLQIKEAEVEQREKEKRDAAATDKQYRDACVPEMYGGDFFEKTLDKELLKLFPIPGVQEAVEEFKTIFNENVGIIGEKGLANGKLRAAERSEFLEALKEGLQENRQEGSKLIDDFLELKDNAQLSMEQMGGDEADAKVDELLKTLKKLRMNLMELEMSLVASIEESTSLFDRSYSDILSKSVEEVQEFTTKIREAEEDCFKRVTDLSVAFLDRQTKGEVTEGVEVTDDLMMLLRDKTTLTSAITGAHDSHLLAIDDKEDEIVSSMKKEYEDLSETLSEDEAKRNRARVAEIRNFCIYHEQDIQTMNEEEEEDD